MNKISSVIRGMDKRMSYNLRLIGSVVSKEEKESEENSRAIEVDDQNEDPKNQPDGQLIEQERQGDFEPEEDIHKQLKNISVNQKKTSIVPRIKMMSDFTVNKLGMYTDEDKQNIEAIKSKLRSIDQTAGMQSKVVANKR